jgi:hypothetical protein
MCFCFFTVCSEEYFFLSRSRFMGHDSAISKVAGYGLDDRGRFPARPFLFTTTVFIPALGPIKFLSMAAWDCFPGVKQPESEAII